jgi:thiamine-phosphate pyrophosphorylase
VSELTLPCQPTQTSHRVDKLNEVIEKFPNLKIFALGGIIQNEQIKEIEKTKAYGFASIRYFI